MSPLNERWLLLGITLLAAYLRLRTIGVESLWHDEVFTVIYTSSRALSELWLQPSDPTPPLYYTLHKLLVGYSESAAKVRAVSALAGIASIPVIYGLGRSLAGSKAGISAALFLAVSGPHIQYSQEARAYAVLFLLILGSAYGLTEMLRRWDTPEIVNWRAQVVFLGLSVAAVYTHYTALLWLYAAQLVLLFASTTATNPRRRTMQWAIGAVWSLIALLPAYWMILKAAGQFQHLSSIGLADMLATLRHMAFVREPWSGDWLGETLLVAALMAGTAIALRQRTTVLVLAVFIIFPIALWAAQIFKPVFMFRTALPFLVVPLLLLALATASLPMCVRWLSAGAIAAVLLTSHLAFERSGRQQQDWTEAARVLKLNSRAGDVIILCAFFDFRTIRFHSDDGSTVPFVGIFRADTALLFPAPAEEKRSWFSYKLTEMPTASPDEVRTGQAPGSRAWVIESNCTVEHRRQMDGFVKALGIEQQLFWEGNGVTIGVSNF